CVCEVPRRCVRSARATSSDRTATERSLDSFMRDSSHIADAVKRTGRGSLFGATVLLGLGGCLLFSTQLLADNVPAHPSIDRTGELRVTNGMTLHVTAD